MAHGIHGDIAADYEGLLKLARQLWGLADQVAAFMPARGRLSDAARVQFLGRHADDFTRRMAVEAANGLHFVQRLADDADLCAKAWKDAMDEENRRRYARHVDDLKKRRSVGQTVWDDLFGWKYPVPPDPVALPRPPAYAATAELIVYSPVQLQRAVARPPVR